MQPPSDAHAPAGVIHDIGYRGYDGPRLGRRAVARALYVHSLRSVFGFGRSAKSKVLPLGIFAVMCLPALILAVVTVGGLGLGAIDEPLLDYSRYATVMQAVIAIFLAPQAPQTVSLDLRFHTVPLYFSRPLERIDYAVAKYAALVTAMFILLAVPILIMYIGSVLAELPVGGETTDTLLALAGAVLFALVLGGLSLLIASMTARRGFGVAAIITVLALSYTVASALQGIIGEGEGNTEAAGWLGLLSPITLVDGVQVWAFGADTSAVAGPAGDAAGITFCLVTLAVIAGCFGLLVLRYRKVKV